MSAAPDVAQGAAKLIEAAGGSPRILGPAVRELARENPALDAEEVVAVLGAQLPEAFPSKKADPADVDLDTFTDAQKIAFIGEHGLETYTRALARQSEKRRAELQRAQRGF